MKELTADINQQDKNTHISKRNDTNTNHLLQSLSARTLHNFIIRASLIRG